ncbi:unnamed protein product [Ectocarpus fasciculatus]
MWLSRAYTWGYLPLAAFSVPFTFLGGTNEQGTFCYNRRRADKYWRHRNVLGYASNNASLIVQFVLLLVLFVKPMLESQERNRTGGAVYRRVIIRNLVCTALIGMSYLITTVFVILAFLKESPDHNTASRVADGVPMVNVLVTLCLTEITLPLGFTSCMKSCSAGNATRIKAGGGVATAAKIVPLEDLPPQAP